MVTTPLADQAPPRARVLAWGIKQSLVRYVEGMADGSIAVDGVTRDEGRFWFPVDPTPDTTLRFTGSVTLTGHSGMLRLVVADPWLEPGVTPGEPWSLSIVDPYEPGGRITFATLAGPVEPGGWEADVSCRLTADGADLFFSGPYTEGTELDSVSVQSGMQFGSAVQ